MKVPAPMVYVVDDDPAIRDVLQWLVKSINTDVATFASAEEFLDAFQPQRCGCIVVDLRMPGMSGLRLLQQLRNQDATIPSIMLTGYADVPHAVRAMHEGAFDFIEKPFSEQELLQRIQDAIAVSCDAFAHQKQCEAFKCLLRQLTPREYDVLTRVVAGDLNKKIATDLGIGERTVETHRQNAMAKLSVRSLAEVVRKMLMVTRQASEAR